MVPPELRRKRVKPSELPPGARWCAGCQSFRDLDDFSKGATRCRPCLSATQHAARTEKVYGLSPEQYAALLALQGGRCAICRQRPKSKRLAVDHDHKTGAVRGLLCGRCNHELLGAGFDSVDVLAAAVDYLATPPAAGAWAPPETKGRPSAATRPADAPAPLGLVSAHGVAKPALAAALTRTEGQSRETYAPLRSLFADLDAALEREKGREIVAAVKALQSRGLLSPPPF